MSGKMILLGVCGGISAFKAVEVLRRLTDLGADVHVIMTQGATRFVSELTFRELSYHPVESDLWAEPKGDLMRHLALAERCDLFLVAPATANSIAKMAHGIADNLLTTTALAVAKPKLMAPAMDSDMFKNGITQNNIARLIAAGWHMVGPESGRLARGNVGEGRLSPPERIVAEVVRLLGPKSLAGRSVLVTAGGTREPLDPVRYLGNRSSGRMGYALADAAAARGAKTVLISGPSALPPPDGAVLISVERALEMREAVLAHATAADAIVMAAAVADYRFEHIAPAKLKKRETGEAFDARLVRNPDIALELGRQKRVGQLVVGFAAETEDVIAHARTKLKEKRLDLIVANDVTQPDAGFDVSTNIVTLVYPDGASEALPKMEKRDVAHAIWDRIERLWPAAAPSGNVH
ncbi:MAG TPA: bifunctional phosphopantothenoylcysteine decarboxylase/phosphopantothenate--cysteine ligase CoaBC [Limnochordia bacterium]|nr:bifunctional phosphopantothenoylcysteine decarboxylase/phosphopantothenate--cysteine ligase CoaBC [Limnochordia bacterium]